VSIVTSTYTEATPLPDGSRYVLETHTDSAGVEHTYGWIGTADAATVLAAHAAEIEQQLAEAEADALLNGG
jgi:ApbE superfamily uncharacterized protein (UPF0280 family)